MADVLKSGSAITLQVTPGSAGFPQTADSVHLKVVIGGVTTWEDPTPILWADAIQGVTFPAAASTITGWNAYAKFIIAWDGGFVTTPVIIEADDILRVLENSFGTWEDIELKSRYMVNMIMFNLASEDQQKAALIQAYHNIGDVHVDFCPPHRRARYQPQNRMWDEEGVFENSGLHRVFSTRMLDEDQWLRVKDWQKDGLLKAQIIEANFLLSDQTPEKQRLAGLLSHSAGESAHFYRTTKPLELPVCRAAALALKGIISYVTRIAG
jgi:hypothetical protein